MVYDILKDSSLTYQQKVIQLARFAENTISPIPLSAELSALMDRGAVSDMFEGNAPYRPRYIVPDYGVLMERGCAFLNLPRPETLEDALASLLVLYHHVPSITTMPVYIGELDSLLDPFVEAALERLVAQGLSQVDAMANVRGQLRRFLIHIDRTITDSFCHANLSGRVNMTTELLVELERELEHAVPNLTLKVTDETTDGLLLQAVRTALKVAKPSFANDAVFSKDFEGRPYALVSCYNGLLIGGGSHTLVRLNLGRLVDADDTIDNFFEKLRGAVGCMLPYMDARVNFLLEQTDFFQSSFLVKEGFIDPAKFTAMFGMVGLADAVNSLLSKEGQRFGHHDEANALGLSIVQAMGDLVQAHGHPALEGTGGHYVLHAQVGLDTDCGISPGCRIPIGDEPPLYQHLLQSAPFHAYFPSGIGDILRFDETVNRNPQAAVDVVRGGFKAGIRYVSLYEDNADVVRITGYLVKKSDIEKLRRGEQVINDAVVLGKGAVDHQRVLERKLRE